MRPPLKSRENTLTVGRANCRSFSARPESCPKVSRRGVTRELQLMARCRRRTALARWRPRQAYLPFTRQRRVRAIGRPFRVASSQAGPDRGWVSTCREFSHSLDPEQSGHSGGCKVVDLASLKRASRPCIPTPTPIPPGKALTYQRVRQRLATRADAFSCLFATARVGFRRASVKSYKKSIIFCEARAAASSSRAAMARRMPA